MEDKRKITREEYEKMFLEDENGCYVNLIIPEIGGYPEMNLIGKRPEDYTLEEITHSKTYRGAMYELILDDEKLDKFLFDFY